MTTDERLRVLVVGQVPPPYGGQTIMTRELLAGPYEHAQLFHVNAVFSDSLAEMGTASFRKLTRLLGVTARALRARLRNRTRVLYITPGGVTRGVVYRDLVLLTVLRPFFRSVVFHFHARGLPAMVESLPKPLRAIARRVYAKPDYVIGPSATLVDEMRAFNPKHALVIANGTEGGEMHAARTGDGPLNILFLNLICAAKGADWLLESFAELRGRGVDAHLTFAGEPSPPDFGDQLQARVDALNLRDHVAFVGVVAGDEKWKAMSAADIFCVPTIHPSESFGLVFIEAASCGLPVVAADIAGVRDVLEPGVSILLADPARPSTLTDDLARLCTDAKLRASLGAAARAAFEDRFSLETYWAQIDAVFAQLQTGATS